VRITGFNEKELIKEQKSKRDSLRELIKFYEEKIKRLKHELVDIQTDIDILEEKHGK